MNVRLKQLNDQVTVVTGASSGIGLTTAEMAAEAGARVMLAWRNENLRSAVNRIGATLAALLMRRGSRAAQHA